MGDAPYKSIARRLAMHIKRKGGKAFFNDNKELIVKEDEWFSMTGWLVLRTYGGDRYTTWAFEPYDPNPPYKYHDDGAELSDDFLKEA